MPEEDDKEQQTSQDREQQDPFGNRRLGMIPGAGPKGARITPIEELPDDAEILKGMYNELEKAYQDKLAESSQQRMMNPGWFPRPRGEEKSTEDILSHFWSRGLELIFVAGAFITLIRIIRPSIDPSSLTVAVLTLVAFWERFVRPFFDLIWNQMQKRWNL